MSNTLALKVTLGKTSTNNKTTLRSTVGVIHGNGYGVERDPRGKFVTIAGRNCWNKHIVTLHGRPLINTKWLDDADDITRDLTGIKIHGSSDFKNLTKTNMIKIVDASRISSSKLEMLLSVYNTDTVKICTIDNRPPKRAKRKSRAKA